MTTYTHCEIMTRQEMYDRKLTTPMYRDEDPDDVLFVRWTERAAGTDIAYQPLDTLLGMLDSLEEMFG